jgi:hypothetical protein
MINISSSLLATTPESRLVAIESEEVAVEPRRTSSSQLVETIVVHTCANNHEPAHSNLDSGPCIVALEAGANIVRGCRRWTRAVVKSSSLYDTGPSQQSFT